MLDTAHRDLRERESPGWMILEVSAPRRSSATGSHALLGSSLLVAGPVSGRIPATPGLVWPLVTLSVAGMAYGLGRKALMRNRP